MHNTLTGLTTSNMPWNPIYVGMMDAPDRICETRQTIAYHDAGHALILVTLGLRELTLRMPSFSDTPHVELGAKLGVRFPDASAVEGKLRRICYLYGGYVAEYQFNQGEHRDIAAMSDHDEGIGLADEIAVITGMNSSRVLIAVAYTLDVLLLKYQSVINTLVRRLIRDGYVSERDFSRIVRTVEQQDLATLVLKNVIASDFVDWSEAYERMFA